MTILNQYTATVGTPTILIYILGIVALAMYIASGAVKNNKVSSVLLVIGIVFSLCTLAVKNTSAHEVTYYEAVFEKSYPFKQLTDEYDIVKRNGELFVLTQKDITQD